MQKQAWVTRDINEPNYKRLRCNFHTRVVIPAERTPSKTRYVFEPGQVRDDILAKDAKFLKSLTYRQSACCGNEPGGPINYFTEV